MTTRSALALAATAVAALIAVPAAYAHAELIGTTPSDGSVLRSAPRGVVLRFDEPLESSFATVEVRDPFGRRIDDRQVRRVDPRTLSVGLRRGLRRGPYRADRPGAREEGHATVGRVASPSGR